MLRATRPLTRRAPLKYSPNGALFLNVSRSRAFADKPSIKDPSPLVLPGSQSKTISTPTPPPPGPVSSTPVVNPKPPTTTPIPQTVPLTPPPPTSSSGPAIPSGAAVPKRKPRRFWRYLFYLVFLSGLGFGGGVWYSTISDNFHDFFTEYVPFGEEAVLYLEEREFRKRFPRTLSPTPQNHASPRVTIPGKAGLSWKVSGSDHEGTDTDRKGSFMSALDSGKSSSSTSSSNSSSKVSPSGPAKSEPAKPQSSKPAPANLELSKSTTVPAKPTPKEQSSPAAKPATTPAVAPTLVSKSSSPGAKRMPEVNEPSVYVPVIRIDPMNIKNANEPVVQDLVKLLNDIILVVNMDNTSSKLASTIDKAKGELSKVGQRIIDMKKAEQSTADTKVKSSEAEFEHAARELVRRLEEDIREQESKWRDEFESERQKISNSYEERLNAEMRKIEEIADQQTRNRLVEQAIALKRDFTSDVKDRVETERNGRLAKLSELSSSVEELEKLASAWNSVIDTNLQTQHLQVAVEAVRANIERYGQRPFIKELAALKEIAADDAVVSSAIASINPAAYQRGIPTSAQLIDRFRSVADEVRKASLLPDDAGIASHAASFLVSKVLFKKQGRAVGDDVESVLTRTETLLEEGSFDEAAREMNGLTGWAKTLSGDWLAELRRVLEVRQALDIISTEARLQSLKVD